MAEVFFIIVSWIFGILIEIGLLYGRVCEYFRKCQKVLLGLFAGLAGIAIFLILGFLSIFIPFLRGNVNKLMNESVGVAANTESINGN